MDDDLLDSATWSFCSTDAGLVVDPEGLDKTEPDWMPATVPGTVASALRDAGRLREDEPLDESDWWFRVRCGRPRVEGSYELFFGGIATLADVWWNGEHVLHSENMFVSHRLVVDRFCEDNDLVIRCASLDEFLAERRPRPRWKTYLIKHPNLRWLRTSLLGRIPGWAATPSAVGPWRPVRLAAARSLPVEERHVVTRFGEAGGEIDLRLRVSGVTEVDRAQLLCGGESIELSARRDGDGWIVEGAGTLAAVSPWWPHTHGEQPLYEASVEIDGRRIDLGRMGFRTVEVDRSDDGFCFKVNGVAVFCRGAVWMPIDAVSLTRTQAELRDALELAREAGMNMIRLPGTGVYEDEAFFDLCDELGLLVWQDCMLAFYDPPTEEAFRAELFNELAGVFSPLGGRPSLAIVCGGQEIESHAAMLGVPRARWSVPLLDEDVRALVAEMLPGVPYLTSNPSGGDLPFQMDAGVCHFFGVGGYARPLSDLRRARVRFASESFAFAAPPEVPAMEEEWGSSEPAGHDPRWKLSVHHDAKRPWDIEDMQSYYVHELFGGDPFLARWTDADRAQDLARATVATVMTEAMSEWRRSGSECSGALVLAMKDLRPGGGWGLCDTAGRPKAPWFALRRAWQPVTLLLTDEGLNGLHLHLVNDTARSVDASLSIALYARGEALVADASGEFTLAPRSTRRAEAASLFEEWWDLTQNYGFGPPPFDAVVATLRDADGVTLAEVFHFIGPRARPVEPDVGLSARVTPCGAGNFELSVGARRLAQWVVVEVPGYHPSDSWFHLAPGAERTLRLRPLSEAAAAPAGRVRALNSLGATRVAVGDG